MLEKLKRVYAEMLEKGIRLPLFRDYKTGAPSVSYSILVIAVTYTMVAIGLNIAGVTDNVSSSMELLYASMALYFGRTFGQKGKEIVSQESVTLPEQK